MEPNFAMSSSYWSREINLQAAPLICQPLYCVFPTEAKSTEEQPMVQRRQMSTFPFPGTRMALLLLIVNGPYQHREYSIYLFIIYLFIYWDFIFSAVLLRFNITIHSCRLMKGLCEHDFDATHRRGEMTRREWKRKETNLNILSAPGWKFCEIGPSCSP